MNMLLKPAQEFTTQSYAIQVIVLEECIDFEQAKRRMKKEKSLPI